MTDERAETSPAPKLDATIVRDLFDTLGPNAPRALARVVTSFLQSSSENLAALAQAARNHDAIGLRAAAHSLKGSAGMLGAARVAALCRQLEVSGAAAPEELNDLTRARDAAVTAWRERLAG